MYGVPFARAMLCSTADQRAADGLSLNTCAGGVKLAAPDRMLGGPHVLLTVAYASLADFFFMAPHTVRFLNMRHACHNMR